MTTWTVPREGTRPAVEFTERPSGTVTARINGRERTVAYLDGGWWPTHPMAPPWVIALWRETDPTRSTA